MASFVPVTYVFIVGIVLELVAEYRRYSNDKKFNHYMVKVIHKSSDGSIKEDEVRAQDL